MLTVAKVRPDLVYALRALRTPVTPAVPPSRSPEVPDEEPFTGRSWLGGLLVALLLAGVVSNYASSHPDGLDSSLREGCTVDADDNIVGGSCPAQQADGTTSWRTARWPTTACAASATSFLSTGLSGVLGVLLTFASAAGSSGCCAVAAPAAPTRRRPADDGRRDRRRPARRRRAAPSSG